MRRLAHFTSRRPRSTLRIKTRRRISENSVMLKPVLNRGRSILPYDAWRVIANSLCISDRELQIVQRIFDDRQESANGDELKISFHPVQFHLERLYRKLGVSSRVELFFYFFSESLSSLPPAF